jgi:hypothetical protein
MGLFSFFRDVVGARKDLVETDKAKLENEKLKEELSPIQRATLDDVKKYDPKIKELFIKVEHTEIPYKSILIAILIGINRDAPYFYKECHVL